MQLDYWSDEINDDTTYSSLVFKLLGEVILDQDKEEVFGVFWENTEEDTYSNKPLKRCYYVITNKRLFKISMNITEFWYKSCPLSKFSGCKESIILEGGNIDDFEEYAYFPLESNEGRFGTRGVTYTATFSFDVDEEELKQLTFKFQSWMQESEFARLRKFVKGFHKALAHL